MINAADFPSLQLLICNLGGQHSNSHWMSYLMIQQCMHVESMQQICMSVCMGWRFTTDALY